MTYPQDPHTPGPGTPSPQQQPQPGASNEPQQLHGQPWQPTPPYGQPSQAPYGQGYGQQPTYGAPTPPAAPWSTTAPAAPVKKKRTGLIVTSIVAVVALAVAGVFIAVQQNSNQTAGSASTSQNGTAGAGGGDAGSGGADTAQSAIQGVLKSFEESDLLGVADQLVPSEASLTSAFTQDIFGQLQRLGIVKADADSADWYTLDITLDGITTSETPIDINDHVRIVEVTGGTVTIESVGGYDSLSDDFIDAIPDIDEMDSGFRETFDIAEQLDETGGALRIATVQVDGRWYPSVFYTIADNAAYTTYGPNYAAQMRPIAPNGASSPEGAMDNLFAAIKTANVEDLVAVLDPDTAGALQEYIGLATTDRDVRCMNESWSDDTAYADSDPCTPFDFTIDEVEWTTAAASRGQKVSIGHMQVTSGSDTVTIDRDPSVPSVTVSNGLETYTFSPDDIDELLGMFAASSDDVPPQVRDMIKREVAQILNLGVVMVQSSDGQWYVSIIDTYMDVVISLLRGLEPADIDYLLDQIQDSMSSYGAGSEEPWGYEEELDWEWDE